MTNTQFDAISKLIRSRNSASTDAARMVLVGKMKKSDAAIACSINRSSVTRVVQSYLDAHELAKIACRE